MHILKSLFGSDATNLNTQEAKARIDSDEPLLILDVRQPDEFRSGHIERAKLIPLNELPGHMNDLPQDTEILCVCRSGSRSSTAVNLLNRSGFKAFNLRGGMMGWQMAGLPMKKGK